MSNEIVQLGFNLDATTTLEQWCDIGRNICREANGMTWRLADWAAFGDREFGKLKEFSEANGLNFGHLRNYAWVASGVDVSRRRDTLSFGHHQEVAPLPASDQKKWLARADEEKLSCADLREAIRASRALQDGKKSDGPSMEFGTKYAMDLSGWLRKQPSDFWTDHNREFWKGQLKPVVEFYQTL